VLIESKIKIVGESTERRVSYLLKVGDDRTGDVVRLWGGLLFLTSSSWCS